MPSIVTSSLDNVRQGNLYDAVGFAELQRVRSISMFGNRNVGNFALSNLQMGGRIALGDRAFILQRWYARTNIPERDTFGLDEAFRSWANTTQCVLIVGNRPEWQLPLIELIDRRPRSDDVNERTRSFDPWPIFVPVRQNVTVRIDSFGTAGDRLAERLGADNRVHVQGPQIWGDLNDSNAQGSAVVWIHLEGIEIDTEGRDHEVHKLIEILTRREAKLRSAEEQIATWLLGVADKQDDDASRAQVMALADGVLEGRARG